VVDSVISSDAAAIVRGVMRVFRGLGYASIAEMTLSNHRRADVCSLGPKGQLVITEVKSSVADFRADQKWPDYLPFCDRFYFAVGHAFPQELIPAEAGLIVADGFGGAILREPETRALAAARRKAVTLRFARMASQRLMRVDAGSISQ
jgi:hypothetical protein